MFQTNVGNIDRAVRVLAGIVLIALFFAFPDSGWRWVFLLGVVPLATGLFSTCPVYSILGISTCPAKRA